MQCAGGVWQRGALLLGTSTAACNASAAGILAASGPSLVGCDGTKWVPFDSGTHTLLLLHMDGAENGTIFTDSSFYGWGVTNLNAITSTAQSKIGGASGFFNGSNADLSVQNSSNFDFGSGDFTIDFWYQPAATGSYRGIISRQSGSWPPWTINDNNSGYVDFAFCSGTCGSSWETFGGLGSPNLHLGTPQVGVWHHYAVVRNGNTFYGFKDGVITSTGTDSNPIATGSGSLLIGAYASYYLSGYIDEFRVSNFARWTANFTPPTSSYSPD